MMYITYLLIAVCGSIGLIELIHMIDRLLYNTNDSTKKIVLLPAKGALEDIEFTIRRMVCHRRWTAKTTHEIYIIDLGLSEESRQILSLIQKDIEGITVCTEEEFPQIFRQNIHLKLVG